MLRQGHDHRRGLQSRQQRARETQAPARDSNIVTRQELRTEIEATRQFTHAQDDMRQRAMTDAIIESIVECYGQRFLKVEDEIIALQLTCTKLMPRSEPCPRRAKPPLGGGLNKPMRPRAWEM
jgi:hypothetical protein